MFRRISHKVRLFTYSWRTIGPRAMARNSIRWAGDSEARNVDSGFDAIYGTDTTAALTPSEAGIPEERRRAATMYLPSMDEDLAAMLGALAWPDRLRWQSTFVDLGSGKGRAVLVAAMRPFRQVVGVELSPILHEIATRNVELVGATGDLVSPVRLVLDDAASYEMPRGPLVIYLYHPFGEPIARAVMARLHESLEARPRPAAILYCHPTLQAPFDRAVFEEGGVFRWGAEGERRTRRFSIGWTVFSNDEWMEARSCSVISLSA